MQIVHSRAFPCHFLAFAFGLSAGMFRLNARVVGRFPQTTLLSGVAQGLIFGNAGLMVMYGCMDVDGADGWLLCMYGVPKWRVEGRDLCRCAEGGWRGWF